MNIGIVIFPDAEELDCVGPWEMLGMWRARTDRSGVQASYHLQVFLV